MRSYTLNPPAYAQGAHGSFVAEWVLIDTETDGLDSPIHIIEIAAQKFKGLEPVAAPFHAFIDHGISIPPAATAVHGYTTEFIQKNGECSASVYRGLREYVNGLPVCGHFLQFDWTRALLPELTRLGESRIGIKGFCTWGLARRSLPELRAHKLDLLREHFGLKCSKPHSASGDVEATVDLLVRVLFPRLIELGYNDFNGVAAFSQLRPISLCHYLVQGQSYEDAVAKIEADRKQTREQVLAAKKAERARLDELQSILNAIGSHQIYVPEQLVHLGFMEEMPSVTFDGRCFQFTGRMNWGQRSKAVAEIMKRGGMGPQSKSSLKGVDYLVLGEDPIDGWTARTTKIMELITRKFNGDAENTRIVLESDFVVALEDTN